MSDEQDQRQGFLSRIFYGSAEDEAATYSPEELEDEREELEEAGEPGITVERAAGIINDLPNDVPRPSAVRIVRQTLEAAGISMEDLGTSTRAREAKLNSHIDLSHQRIQKLRSDADQEIRSLEGRIREVRDARDSGVSTEERRISESSTGLEEIEVVREFFGLREDEGELEEPSQGDEPGDDTQVIDHQETEEEEDTQVLGSSDPLSDDWETGNR